MTRPKTTLSTELPDWLLDLGVELLPLEADDGTRVFLTEFEEMRPSGCGWFPDGIPVTFDLNMFDWLMYLYGPFAELDLKNCYQMTNRQLWLFTTDEYGMLKPSVPYQWPLIATIFGDLDPDRQQIYFYITRNIIRNAQIRTFLVGIPTCGFVTKPKPGTLRDVFWPSLAPIMFYVHDTYSKFSNNGIDWTNRAFGGPW